MILLSEFTLKILSIGTGALPNDNQVPNRVV